MRTRSHTLATVLVAGILGLSGVRAAVAQSDQERAGARAAATEGLAAFNESRWADAIDLFRRAETLVHAPTHLLLSARAHVKLGKLVQAREIYIKITKETLAATAPQPFRDAQTEATRELAALEPRLARVTIKVQGEAKNIAVISDGEPMSSVLIGVPQPFDPGKHEIKATAERMESKPTTVDVAEGGRQTVLLVLEPSATPIVANPVGPALTGPLSTGPLSTAEAPRAPETVNAGSGNGMRIAAYSALGVGVVGLASGIIFGLGAKSDYTKADDICSGPGGCPETRRSEIDDLDSSASGKKTLATVGLIVGGLGISGGVVLLVLSGRSSRKELSAHTITVRPEVGTNWIGLRGSF